MIAGRMWSTENEKVAVRAVSGSDAVELHESIKLLMQIVAMQLGIPPTTSCSRATTRPPPTPTARPRRSS